MRASRRPIRPSMTGWPRGVRANAISLAAHRNGIDQTNRFIKKLQDERNQLRAQLLEAESEIARLQILVSTPMSLEQHAAEPAFASPSPV